MTQTTELPGAQCRWNVAFGFKLFNFEDISQVRADASRTVLRGKWEDCSPECPGYDLSGEESIHQAVIDALSGLFF